MEVELYEKILESLKKYNSSIPQNYGNEIVSISPTNPTYPLTVFDEIRNVANRYYNTPYERVSSVGYRLDIYAKTKGNVTKQTIARRIAKEMDCFMTDHVGLLRVGYAVSELENDSSIYHIILTYDGNLNEHRNDFI